MPNSYQESPSFLLNLIATALFEGEAFCLATRNDRGEVSSLNLLPPNTCSPMVDDETKSIFYSVGSSPLAEGGTDYVVPARDVMHLRFHTPRHPLIGESPIKAAALAININVALNKSQSAFFSQMSRPSGVISYEGTPDRPFLDAKQMESLKQAWANASQAMNQGKVPILGANMKFQPMGVTSQDAQLVEAQNMSIADIGRVFGVPSPLINDLANATLNNSESLMRSFLSMSLGSYIEHIERQFDRLFNLGNDEKIELNTAALLRTDFNGRIDGLSKAVQGGVMTPNEARAMESLGEIEGGDTAFLQKQMIPLDEIKELLARERENAEAQAQAPVVEETQENEISPEYAKLLIQDLIKQKKAATNHA
jgi:HK97 family phage portal protein